MAEPSSAAGKAGQDELGADSPCKEGEQMAPASSFVEKGKAAVGAPNALLRTTTPSTSMGFTDKAAPPTLRRSRKTRVLSSPSPTIDDGPIIIDMEAALRAVAGKLAAAQVLSPYPSTPKMSSTRCVDRGGCMEKRWLSKSRAKTGASSLPSRRRVTGFMWSKLGLGTTGMIRSWSRRSMAMVTPRMCP